MATLTIELFKFREKMPLFEDIVSDGGIVKGTEDLFVLDGGSIMTGHIEVTSNNKKNPYEFVVKCDKTSQRENLDLNWLWQYSDKFTIK